MQFWEIRRTKVIEVLDRFPNYPNWTIAKVLYSEAPELFNSVEHARGVLRYLRGVSGDTNRKRLKDKSYVQPI